MHWHVFYLLLKLRNYTNAVNSFVSIYIYIYSDNFGLLSLHFLGLEGPR